MNATPEDTTLAKPFVSYAQQGEDVRLHRALGHVVGGHYLDVGANDPVEDSVTYAFYRRGWSGVAVEPVAEFSRSWDEVRPRDRMVAALAGARAEQAVLTVIPGTGLSHLGADATGDAHSEQRTVSSVRVDDILDEAAQAPLHLAVIDVEGAEADVLHGFDLRRWRPWVLVIEATRPGTSEMSDLAWEDNVLASGYVEAAFDGLNKFFVSEDHLELVDQVATPPNVFDDYETIHDRRRLEEIARLTADADDLTSRLRSAEQQVRVVTAEARLTQGTLTTRLRAVEGDADGLRTEVDRLRAEHDLLVQSLSWRVTAPVRSAMEAARRARTSAPRAAAPVLRKGAGLSGRARRWAVADPRRHELIHRLVTRVPAIKLVEERLRRLSSPSSGVLTFHGAGDVVLDARAWHTVLSSDLERRTARRGA